MRKKVFIIRNRGFTLIELLAVIVILAIILIIVVPLVVNVISDARKNAFEAAARGIIKTAENECMTDLLDYNIGSREIEFNEWQIISEDELSFSGRGPKEGIVYINENCEFGMAIHDDNWCITKPYDGELIVEPYDGDCFIALGGSWTFEVETTSNNEEITFNVVDADFVID